jgi:hypothetical protein
MFLKNWVVFYLLKHYFCFINKVTGKAPWSEIPPQSIIYLVGTNNCKPLSLPDEYSSEIKNFVCVCLQHDQRARPTAQILLMHAFLMD